MSGGASPALIPRRPSDRIPTDRRALGHFERAVELKPDSAVLQSDLGSALAAAGRFAEAMQHVRRALELNPEYGPALENLQRLQQMGIR